MLAPKGITGSIYKGDGRLAKSISTPCADIHLGTSFPSGLLRHIVLAVRGVTNTSHMPQGRLHNTVPGLCRTGHKLCCVRFRPVQGLNRQFLFRPCTVFRFCNRGAPTMLATCREGNRHRQDRRRHVRTVKVANATITPTYATAFPAGFYATSS